MSVLFLAGAIYLYLLFLGWGLTRIALPRALSQYQVWLAPWFGMMLATVLGVQLSRLGLGAAVAVYPVTLLAAGLAAWGALSKFRSPSVHSFSHVAFASAFLISLSLALYPLLCLHTGPTTVSLGNNDPINYAATARFLELGSIRRPPVCDVSRPLTCLVGFQIAVRARPGAYLLISLVAAFLHLQTYQVFTVLLAVLLALTAILVGIFVKVASGSWLAALLALFMSALSVNQLYFFYHGFAGQVFCEGCLIIAFTLLWLAEDKRERWFSPALMLGLTICAMLELYQEDVPLYLIPYGVYFVLQFLTTKTPKARLVRRFVIPIGIAFALDPFALWYCFAWLSFSYATVVGWPMPRWALPVDAIGLMDVYLPGNNERVAAIASIPVAFFALWGVLYWRNPRLTLSVISVGLALLLHEYAIRHFSYTYHKLIAIVSFLLIGAFATGIMRAVRGHTPILIRRYAAGAALTLCAAGCFLTAIPLIAEMKRTQLSVSPDLVQLTAVKRLVGNQSIRLVEDRWWQQLWVVYFLDPVPTLPDHPSAYFMEPAPPPVSASVFTLLRMKNDHQLNFLGGQLLWHDSAYYLYGPGP